MAVNIQPLRPFMQFVLDNNQLTKEAYDFLYNMFLRVGGSLSSLNAATLLDKTWSEPAPIGNITPSSGKFTTLESTSNTVVGGTLTAASLSITGSVAYGSDLALTNGDLLIQGTGKGIIMKSGGANARIGRVTLVAGAATVNTTIVSNDSNIYLTCRTQGGTPGFLRVSTILNGTSFNIVSSSGTDTSVVNWLIIDQQ